MHSLETVSAEVQPSATDVTTATKHHKTAAATTTTAVRAVAVTESLRYGTV